MAEKNAEYEDEVHQANNKQQEMKKLLEEETSKAKEREQEAIRKSQAVKKEFEKAKKELFAKEAELEKKAMKVRFKRQVMTTTNLQIVRSVVLCNCNF